MPSQFAGPMPPTGRTYCILCAAGWKAEALNLARERKVDLTGSVNLSAMMSGRPLPALAVADGPLVLPVPAAAGQPGQIMVVAGPQCWTHLMAINLVESQLQLAPAGMGGAQLLGR